MDYGHNLTTILPLNLRVKLFMLILIEIIYSLRYNTLITVLRKADHNNNNIEITITQQYSF